MQEITFQSFRNSKIFCGSMPDPLKFYHVFGTKCECSFQPPHPHTFKPALRTLLFHHIPVPDSRNLVPMHVDGGRLSYIHSGKFYLCGAAGHHRFQQRNSTLHPSPNEKGLVSPLLLGADYKYIRQQVGMPLEAMYSM